MLKNGGILLLLTVLVSPPPRPFLATVRISICGIWGRRSTSACLSPVCRYRDPSPHLGKPIALRVRPALGLPGGDSPGFN